MLYKTIVLELLKQHPTLHDRLRHQRLLLPLLEHLARKLKDRHHWWQEQIRPTKPGSQPRQLASEALEIALQELQDRLSSASVPDEHQPLSLDDAMAFLRLHTP